MNGSEVEFRQIVRALILAPLPPVALLVLVDGIGRAVQFGIEFAVGAVIAGFFILLVMEIFTLMVGYPLVVSLRRDRLNSLSVCLLSGGLIASLPFTLLALLAPLPDSASVDGRPTVIDGHRTFQWFVEMGTTTLFCFGFGLLGGYTFWRIYRKLRSQAEALNIVSPDPGNGS